MSNMGECQQQKHAQHAPSMKTECEWLKNGHIHKNLTQDGEPQRYGWGVQKKKKKKISKSNKGKVKMFN